MIRQVTRLVKLYVAKCNNCSDTWEGDGLSFDEFRKAITESGWRAIKANGVWQHICPRCDASEVHEA